MYTVSNWSNKSLTVYSNYIGKSMIQLQVNQLNRLNRVKYYYVRKMSCACTISYSAALFGTNMGVNWYGRNVVQYYPKRMEGMRLSSWTCPPDPGSVPGWRCEGSPTLTHQTGSTGGCQAQWCSEGGKKITDIISSTSTQCYGINVLCVVEIIRKMRKKEKSLCF